MHFEDFEGKLLKRFCKSELKHINCVKPVFIEEGQVNTRITLEMIYDESNR
jgi:hypothetical protein